MPECLFNKIAGLYAASLLEEKILIQVCSNEFWEIFKTPFLRNTLCTKVTEDCLKTAGQENDSRRKELEHYLRQIFISCCYSKIYLFLCSLLPMIHWNHVFLKTVQSHWKRIFFRRISVAQITHLTGECFIQSPFEERKFWINCKTTCFFYLR